MSYILTPDLMSPAVNTMHACIPRYTCQGLLKRIHDNTATVEIDMNKTILIATEYFIDCTSQVHTLT